MKFIRFYLFLLPFGMLTLPAWGESAAVTWSARFEPADARAGEGARVVVTARIAPGWHIYSLTPAAGGPVPTAIELTPGKVLTAAGKALQPKPERKHDPGFDME